MTIDCSAEASARAKMIEIMMVFGGIVLLGGVSYLALVVPPLALAYVCLGLMFTGFAVGVPSGFYYHLLLRQELLKLGALPKGWYWRPFTHQALLDDDAIARLRPWWMVGGFGFLLISLALVISIVVLFTQRSYT